VPRLLAAFHRLAPNLAPPRLLGRSSSVVVQSGPARRPRPGRRSSTTRLRSSLQARSRRRRRSSCRARHLSHSSPYAALHAGDGAPLAAGRKRTDAVMGEETVRHDARACVPAGWERGRPALSPAPSKLARRGRPVVVVSPTTAKASSPPFASLPSAASSPAGPSYRPGPHAALAFATAAPFDATSPSYGPPLLPRPRESALSPSPTTDTSPPFAPA
jgi:hypothetical protein